MEGRAASGGAVEKLTGTAFGERDQLLHRAYGQRRMHFEYLGRRRDLRDRRKVSPRVVGTFLIQAWIDRVAHAGDEKRVSVRGGARSHLLADVSARARAIVDD